jgi:hypothetical protein
MEDVPRYLFAVAALVILYLVVRRRWNLKIVVRGEDIRVSGQAIVARAVQVRNFFRLDMPEVDSCKVTGYYNGQRLQLWYQGLSPGQQQRIRNFLTELL